MRPTDLPNRSKMPDLRRTVGFTAAGQPIYRIAGGDNTATADLHQRRSELLALLENPAPDLDVAATVAEAEDIATRITAANTAARSAAEARRRLLDAVPVERDGGVTPDNDGGGQRVRTYERAGDLLLNSESFQQFRARNNTGNAQITLPGGLRALIDNSATSAGAFQNPQRPTDVPVVNADRQPRLADLVDRRTTDSNTVEYVQETTTTPEGAAAEVAEGGAKAEATYTFAVVSEPVRTVAHWVNITRQSADDNSMMRGYIEGRLAFGLEHRLDSQILNGNGTSPNLRGILNVTGTGTYTAPASEAAVISIRRAITEAQDSEYEPDTVVLRPIDWERTELSMDDNGMFRVTPNAANRIEQRIWGLAVVVTTAIAANKFLVGAFRMGATLWERQGTTILVTDSHASNFTSNILTILAEMRAALAVWRPKAFVEGDFDAAGL